MAKKVPNNKAFNQTIMVQKRNHSNIAVRPGMKIENPIFKPNENSPNLQVRLAFANNTLF